MREVLLMTPGLGVHVHRAKLKNHEPAASKSYPLLPIKDRTWRHQFDPAHDEKEQGQPNRKRQHNTGDVEKSFPPRACFGSVEWKSCSGENRFKVRDCVTVD